MVDGALALHRKWFNHWITWVDSFAACIKPLEKHTKETAISCNSILLNPQTLNAKC
jgi:hypothetical protein